MQVYYIIADPTHGNSPSRVVGPYTEIAEAERAMTRVAEQGYQYQGSRDAFQKVSLLTKEED